MSTNASANPYDLVIIGGGPAGYVPAVRAAMSGHRVAVVEEDELGGTCLNRGCIPTKTLVASTTLLRHAAEAKRFGLGGSLTFCWTDLARRRDLVVKRLRKGIEAHFDQLGIRRIREHGTLAAPGEVLAGSERLRSRFVLLSPGSLPALPGPFATEGAETSDDVLAWDDLPGSLTIVGGGVIGCEFASIFSALGVRVSIVEMLPDILPGIDDDVRGVVRRSLERAGVSIRAGSQAASVAAGTGGTVVTLAGGDSVAADRLLVAIGRRPRIAGMGLEEAGVTVTGKGIVTDDSGQTNLPGVYAAGDATGKWQLAHAGSAQALAALDHMFGAGNRSVNPDAMPGCIFTSPEIAVVGPGQEEWERRGVRVRAGISRYIANGKAVGMNETEGFVKVIAREADDVVVGVQIVGADASSLVGEAVLAVHLGVRAAMLGEMIHPHPTLSELFMEAGDALGPGAIHG